MKKQVSVYLPTNVHIDSKKRAIDMDMKFSLYIETLIRKDLGLEKNENCEDMYECDGCGETISYEQYCDQCGDIYCDQCMWCDNLCIDCYENRLGESNE